MNNIQKFGYTIGFPIARDKAGVIQFLNNNLVITKGLSDEALMSLMIDKFTGDPALYSKYIAWLSKQIAYNNVVGDSGSVASSGGSDFWGDFNAGSIAGLLGSAGSIFAGIQSSKDQRAAAEAAAKAAQAQAQAQISTNQSNLQALQMQLQMAMSGGAKGNNTALYVVLGVVAVGVLGTVIYFVAKK